MFKVKRRNILVISLVCVLCSIGYLNYAMNKYVSLETSNEFEKYEENKLSELTSKNENREVDEIVSGEIDQSAYVEYSDDTQVVEVIDSSDSQIEDIITETSKTINQSITNNQSIKRTNYFIESRMNMNAEREKMIVLLNEIINNDRTDESNRKAANDEKMELIDIMNKEKIIENLIKAKGFEETIVFITDHSVNVILEIEKLTDADVAKVLDIVMRETKFSTDNIKILNKF
ncbi:SpoIIIAH-like family protein [Marinisporobacter balticus]|uniref:Stage III sporulation protein AH n=1 Tax=Marinisporobacter balticus TaxID=2018667 RepID=A0A4R2L5A4_9FIRM|nr:SpoIIIAH-like family protein [Marinisporobacter balticus]TCO79189.1 stage III sporulation protein AH [Marinisporobacter balticus]